MFSKIAGIMYSKELESLLRKSFAERVNKPGGKGGLQPTRWKFPNGLVGSKDCIPNGLLVSPDNSNYKGVNKNDRRSIRRLLCSRVKDRKKMRFQVYTYSSLLGPDGGGVPPLTTSNSNHVPPLSAKDDDKPVQELNNTAECNGLPFLEEKAQPADNTDTFTSPLISVSETKRLPPLTVVDRGNMPALCNQTSNQVAPVDEPDIKGAPRTPESVLKLDPELTETMEASTSQDSIATSICDSEHQPEMADVALRGRQFAKRQKRRLVYKNGECNISTTGVSERKRRYLVDIFTTMLDSKWRYNVLVFALGFMCSWLTFALLWWLICLAHGDNLHKDDDSWTPCMTNVYDFTTALLFSVETQHTIGYGFRAMEPICPEAVVLLMVQSCFGVFIQCLVTGLIFAKLSRPKRRGQTIMFTHNAVISQRDGQHCLLFRVGDMRRSHFIGANIRALLVKNRLTKEGERIPLCQYPLKVEPESCLPDDNYLSFFWPVTVVHWIDKSSPLWETSADMLLTERFEIIVILEGTVEATGMTTQVRTSYLPSEIVWGHCLAPLLTYQKENGLYKIDHAQFHATIPIEHMTEISAKDLSERDEHISMKRLNSSDYSVNFTSPFIRRDESIWTHPAKLVRSLSAKTSNGDGKNVRSKKKTAASRFARFLCTSPSGDLPTTNEVPENSSIEIEES